MKTLVIRAAAIALIFAPVITRANIGDGSTKGSNVFEVGLHTFSGPDDGSLSGTNGYFFGFGSYAGRRTFRGAFLVDVGWASGNIRHEEGLIAATLLHARASVGLDIHPLETRLLSPFIGAHGLFGWHLIKATTPPTGEDLNVLAYHYGYETFVGTDIDVFSRNAPIRLKFSYEWLTTTYGGQAIGLGGFRISMGVLL